MNQIEELPQQNVILFCGIPGSGKSTLCRHLENHIKSLSPNVVRSIDFDEVYFQSFDVQDEFDGVNWKKTRCKAFSLAKEFLESGSIILIDDNMYYSSMRREYWHLCGKYSAGFVQIYVKTHLDVALKRNLLRTGTSKIPEEVIFKINERFEEPDSTKRSFEQNTIVVDGDYIHVEDIKKYIVDQLWPGIMEVLKKPVIDRRFNQLDILKDQSRQTNTESFGHQMDLRTRRILSELMQSSPITDKKLIAALLAQERRNFLNNVKNNSIALPEEANIDEDSLLQALEHHFYLVCQEKLNEITVK